MSMPRSLFKCVGKKKSDLSLLSSCGAKSRFDKCCLLNVFKKVILFHIHNEDPSIDGRIISNRIFAK
jgi:hypothetical protein